MLDVMNLDDEDVALMLRYRAGDDSAFASLYARHKAPLYRYLLRHVRNAGAAADLFQDVWSRLIATRSRYEPRAKFATFLFQIAHNCAVDFFRRDCNSQAAVRHEDAEIKLNDAEAPEHLRPDRIAEFSEQQSALLQALAELPSEQREAFLLREESGLSIEDIARVMDVPPETAKSRLRYAVRKLKNSMAREAAAERLPLKVRTV
jgi:RNA polymerase sigma-70 factor (ECF subfamily)